MKTREHVDSLFSLAYDGELASKESERFQQHLKECTGCTERYAHFTQSIDDLKALPSVAMPVPVHLLPGTPDAPSRLRFMGALRNALASTGPRRLVTWSTAAVGVAGALVIGLLLVHNGEGGNEGSRSNAPLARNAPSSPEHAGSARPDTCPASEDGGALSQDAGRRVLMGTLGLANLPNHTTASDSREPNRTLVLATSATHASPGARIPVVAELIAAAPGGASPSSSYVFTPCVRVSEAAPSVLNAPGDAAAPAPAAPSLARQPNQALDVSRSPLQMIIIPAGAKPGTVLHLTASVPGGVPAGSERPLIADLVVTVD